MCTDFWLTLLLVVHWDVVDGSPDLPETSPRDKETNVEHAQTLAAAQRSRQQLDIAAQSLATMENVSPFNLSDSLLCSPSCSEGHCIAGKDSSSRQMPQCNLDLCFLFSIFSVSLTGNQKVCATLLRAMLRYRHLLPSQIRRRTMSSL